MSAARGMAGKHMDDKKHQTTEAYNASAKALAEKFDGMAERSRYVEETLALVGPAPRVLEIGCGSGRDAVAIMRHTDHYLGMDISAPLIELARAKVPHADFVVADVETYEFPPGLDAVFAFASLIHSPRGEMRSVLARILAALKPGGVLYLSMKHADSYREVTRVSEFGTRTYYHYSQADLRELAAGFQVVKDELEEVRGQIWVEMLLQKPRV